MNREKIIYFGFDECFGSSTDSHIILVMTVSRSHEEVHTTRYIEKQRAIIPDALMKEFLHACININGNNRTKTIYQATEELIYQGTNKFCNPEDEIEFYFDRNEGLIQKLKQLQNHPRLNFKDMKFIQSDDTKIPLINRADHLANILSHYYSKRPKSIERVN